ncbi:l-ascorbate oxidase-like protein [Hordeum vulgare]|nr:l-ascorbate oxidase-like protein [Hordeum vulgare]
MEGSKHASLWFQVDGFCNRPTWVAVDLSPRSTMFLMRRWKTFARSRGLGPEHLLHFRFDGDTMLSMKFFGSSGSRLECCVESSSDSDLDTSSESDDGDSSTNAMLEGDDSE